MSSKIKKEKKHYLTVFLLKDRYKKLNDIKDIVPKKYEKMFNGFNGQAKAYLYRNNEKMPNWVNSFGDIFDLSNIRNSIYALIIYIEVNNRILVLTTSFGHTKILKDRVENDFGLKVALNKVEDKALRSVDARNLTLASHQKREVSSSNSSLQDFDFDSGEDFLKAISGKSPAEFALKMKGGESLNIVKRFDIKEILNFCKELLVLYKQKRYISNGFDFIDDLKKINDSAVYFEMKKKIVKAINDRDNTKLVLAYPEIEEYDFCNYKIILNNRSKYLNDINIEELFGFLNEKGFSNIKIDDLDKIKIELLDENGETYRKPKVKRRYNLFDYLVFELEKGGKKYIYINNQLYLIAKDYYDKLFKFLEKKEKNTKLSIELPLMKFRYYKKKGKEKLKIENEGDYNDRIKDLYKKSVYKFDCDLFRKKIKGKKASVEICDILTKEREFVCVKTYKKSSTALSHLFFQGTVSAELLADDENYKKTVIDMVKSDFRIKLDERSKIKYIFAIASQREGRVTNNLPIFSMISLRKAIMDLEKRNYKAGIIKIDFEKVEDKKIKI